MTTLSLEEQTHADRLETRRSTIERLLRKYHPAHDAAVFDALCTAIVLFENASDDVRANASKREALEARTSETVRSQAERRTL